MGIADMNFLPYCFLADTNKKNHRMYIWKKYKNSFPKWVLSDKRKFQSIEKSYKDH